MWSTETFHPRTGFANDEDNVLAAHLQVQSALMPTMSAPSTGTSP
jgi:hypothetical protein